MSYKRRKQNTWGIDIEGVTGSDSNGNSKTTHLTKIMSFSINDITDHDYSIQLMTPMIKLMKNLFRLK